MPAIAPNTLRQPVAETTNGKIRGVSSRGAFAFKGVRYGATTAGGNRFLPPQEPDKWAGIKDAIHWGPSAPQSPMPAYASPFYSWYSKIEAISEDCLFLNLFTPGLDDGKRPVMVWLHGGGWRGFASSAPGFDATALACAQDVVVVTINHRLNGLGFLAIDDADPRFADSGNAGMLDIVLALRWVRDNAAAFGGDPLNVTVFGQSGGAAKVAALLAMPAANGLFHKAIIQSTSGGMRIASRDEAVRMAAELAGVLGVERLIGTELQRLPMEVLLGAIEKSPGPYRPVIDGRSFYRDPYYPDAPDTSFDVPLMAGTTDTETTWYYDAYPDNFSLKWADVSRRLKRFLKLDDAAAEKLESEYRLAYPDHGACDILTAITTDYLFKRNTLRIATLHATQERAPVYCYVFARETPVANGRFRSPHAAELPFIFGTTDVAAGQCGTGTDIQPMTDIMMATWVAFAHNGDPNNSLIPAWKQYTEPARQTMVLNVDSRLVSNPGGEARAAMDGLPYYEYSNDRASFLKN